MFPRRSAQSWCASLDERVLILLQSMIPIVEKTEKIYLGQDHLGTVYAIGGFYPDPSEAEYLPGAKKVPQLSDLPLTQEQLAELKSILFKAGVPPEQIYYRRCGKGKGIDIVVVTEEISIHPPRKLIYANLLLE